MTVKEIWGKVYQNLLPLEDEREALALAYRIVEHFTGFDKLHISLYPQTEIKQDTVFKINEAISELNTRKPIQYIIGKTKFGEANIFVDENVLIPRPETEELLFWMLKENPECKGTLIDVCTGSACIAIAFGIKNPKAQIYAIDYTSQILELAKKNALSNDVQVDFLCYNILSEEFINSFNQCCDIIVSNPPYVRQSEKKFMHDKVLKFEPAAALFVPDEDPLIFYRAITQWACKNLVIGGKLYLEINESLANEVILLLQGFNFHSIELRFDMQNKARMIKAIH